MYSKMDHQAVFKMKIWSNEEAERSMGKQFLCSDMPYEVTSKELDRMNHW